MIDIHGRTIEYLRISVTQNCDLKCIYCATGSCTEEKNQCTIFTPQDYKVIIGIMAELGIKKVRITGGEPLMRPDIYEIIKAISSIENIRDVSMTTNGVHLEEMAQKLKNAGLTRINISLDSLDKDRFKYITGADKLQNVVKGITKAINIGLLPVKINTVLIKGVNDSEIEDFIKLTKELPVDVRFIELMPIGKFGEENRDKVVYNSEIILAHPQLKAVEEENFGQPAKYFKIEGYKGRIGFISPISHNFCDGCNRIRLTCDGKIRPCLGNNGEVDITKALGEPMKLRDIISRTIFEKPIGNCFGDNFVSDRNMNQIGG